MARVIEVSKNGDFAKEVLRSGKAEYRKGQPLSEVPMRAFARLYIQGRAYILRESDYALQPCRMPSVGLSNGPT